MAPVSNGSDSGAVDLLTFRGRLAPSVARATTALAGSTRIFCSGLFVSHGTSPTPPSPTRSCGSSETKLQGFVKIIMLSKKKERKKKRKKATTKRKKEKK